MFQVQDRRRLAPKFDRPLEQAFASNKADKKNCQNHLSYTCRISFIHCFYSFLFKRPPAQVKRQRKQVTLHLSDLSLSRFLRCFTHITQKDHLPKSSSREKQPSGPTWPQKNIYNSREAFNIYRPHGPNHFQHTPTRSFKRAP